MAATAKQAAGSRRHILFESVPDCIMRVSGQAGAAWWAEPFLRTDVPSSCAKNNSHLTDVYLFVCTTKLACYTAYEILDLASQILTLKAVTSLCIHFCRIVIYKR